MPFVKVLGKNKFGLQCLIFKRYQDNNGYWQTHINQSCRNEAYIHIQPPFLR